MAKDDETGVDPVATDGDPKVEDLEKRRAARGGNGGKSVAERGAEGDQPDAEEDDGQFAMGLIEATLPPTLSRLIPRGMPVKVSVSMGTGAVEGKGLFGADEDIILVTRFRVRKYEPVPKREDGKTVEFEIRQHLTPLFSATAASPKGLELVEEAKSRAKQQAAS